MGPWARLVGLVMATAAAPLFGAGYALADGLSTALASDVPRVRHALQRHSRWMAASTRPRPTARQFRIRYRIALRIDVSESALPRHELEPLLREINEVWAQAGICFDMRDTRLDPVRDHELVLRLIGGSDDAPVFGMFDGHRDMWTLDRPALDPARHPTNYRGSRTASHELGHALGLRHYRRRHDAFDSLMGKGTRGFRLHPFEIDKARAAARTLGSARHCGEPQLL